MVKEGIPPLYKKVMGDIKALIDSGEYKKDQLIPSENELCKTYNTTRSTVRLGLAELINMGYLTRRHGKGSFVSEPKRGLGILSLGGVTAGIGDQKLTTVILQKQRKQDWPIDFYYSLNKEEKSRGCIFFTRLRYIDNIPVLYEETYIGNIQLNGFVVRNLENRSLFKILKENYNIEIQNGEQRIWAKTAGEQIGKLLSMKKTAPIVHMKRKLNTNINDLTLYSFIYCNTEDYYLEDFF
jgi:GntR family transcriptional regulator/GntR family frlABCD operon transcriptional regulator